MTTTTILHPRTVHQIVAGIATSDGGGVKLKRIIGTPRLRNLDPFLMLDEFRSDTPQDYLAGFPDHPHRGFQTVSYLLAGRMRHADSRGHSGVIQPGGVQWMNAGRGLIHSEMPEQADGLLWGFQLWVNLPASLKMSEPAYQEFDPSQIPVAYPAPGVTVKVIAGTLDTRFSVEEREAGQSVEASVPDPVDSTPAIVEGAVKEIASRPLFIDVRLQPGAHFMQNVPEGHTAFLYVYQGDVKVLGTTVQAGQLAELTPGDFVTVKAPAGDANTPETGFLLIAGAPIREPIAARGPFVMNTWDEIQEAINDYAAGRLG